MEFGTPYDLPASSCGREAGGTRVRSFPACIETRRQQRWDSCTSRPRRGRSSCGRRILVCCCMITSRDLKKAKMCFACLIAIRFYPAESKSSLLLPSPVRSHILSPMLLIGNRTSTSQMMAKMCDVISTLKTGMRFTDGIMKAACSYSLYVVRENARKRDKPTLQEVKNLSAVEVSWHCPLLLPGIGTKWFQTEREREREGDRERERERVVL